MSSKMLKFINTKKAQSVFIRKNIDVLDVQKVVKREKL